MRARLQSAQMADLARLAGVSVSTVSRALSNHPRISESTRTRILDLARSINYQVNTQAAALRKRKVQTIGVVLLTDTFVSDPFVLQLLGHIADQLTTHHINILLHRLHTHQVGDISNLVYSGQAGGVIVIGQNAFYQEIEQLFMAGLPTVVWGAQLPETRISYPVVGGDNEKGGYIATQHLLAKGCRNILFVGEHHHPEALLRHRGYVRALQEAGLPARPEMELLAPFDTDHRITRQAVAAWLSKHKTPSQAADGIFCISDMHAISVIAALSERGLRVPQDMKLVGYDDIPLAAYFHPSLSSIRQDTALAGQALTQAMLTLLTGQIPDSVVLPTELVIRESSS